MAGGDTARVLPPLIEEHSRQKLGGRKIISIVFAILGGALIVVASDYGNQPLVSEHLLGLLSLGGALAWIGIHSYSDV